MLPMKKIKAQEEEQRQLLRFEALQRSPHVDPHAEMAVPKKVSDKKNGRTKQKQPKWRIVR